MDGNRTIAFVIGPCTQTGKVDSTRTSTVSLLRTIELILGVEPLTHFDALARPIWKAFTARPDVRPCDARVPAVSLAQRNTPGAPLSPE